MHNHHASTQECISCLYYSMQMLFYGVFYILPEIMLIIIIMKLCEFWCGNLLNNSNSSLIKVNFVLICVELYGINQVQSFVLIWISEKNLISSDLFTLENPFQNRSTFWGWALKQKCRAYRVVQSWFLEFSKLFSKIWSNLKRRNSLNIPFLNSNLHFKM